MSAPPLTRITLLTRLKNPNDTQAWSEFLHLYASVIYGFARKRGLQDADAADLMQDVLRAVAGAIGRLEYDSKKGTFRAWLYRITRNKVYTFLDRGRRIPRGTGDSGAHARLEELPSAPDEDADWDKEYEQKVFQWAADRVKKEFRANTWDAFWATAVNGEDPAIVGERLGLSPGAVYVAKSRVLARLREEIQTLNDDVGDD